MRVSFLSSTLLLAGASVPWTQAADTQCKCTPHDPCWPSDNDFQTLNQTVGGNLIRGVPPGSVCYKDQPNSDEKACQYVIENWFTSTFHAENPISIGWPQWANNPCPPIYPNGTSPTGDIDAGKKGCSIGAYPVLSLNATNVTHIQDAFRFANQHNIRINTKSTGHSFTGRSTAYGSISIWTHYMQGIEYHENFQPDSCPTNETQMGFSIAAGARVRDVYEAADKHDAIVVAGSAQDVGIVGWFTGAGHGPLSSTYGMGADNVLQVTIVTPKGDIVTANNCLNPELFWAIRGGGGGTFGVITEVVMKAYPSPTMQSQSFALTLLDRNDPKAFWDALAYFYSELPNLKAGGLSGYTTIAYPPLSPDYIVVGSYSSFNQPNGSSEKLFAPLKEHYSKLSKTIAFESNTTYSPSFFASWNTSIGFEPVGSANAILGSRLLPATSLTNSPANIAAALQNISTVSLGMQAHMIANSANRDLNISLNPVWRDTVVHNIAVTAYADNATAEEIKRTEERSNEMTAQLKALAPDSGAYFNEADPFDPDWQYTFFGGGERYARLKKVKNSVDPGTSMWCLSCIGSEEWEEDDTGRLCQKSWMLQKQDL